MKYPYDFNATSGWFIQQAREFYRRYMDAQRQIEVFEEAAKRAASGHAPSVDHMLHNEGPNNGHTYRSLVGARNIFMTAAQLNATMATMCLLDERPSGRVGGSEEI